MVVVFFCFGLLFVTLRTLRDSPGFPARAAGHGRGGALAGSPPAGWAGRAPAGSAAAARRPGAPALEDSKGGKGGGREAGKYGRIVKIAKYVGSQPLLISLGKDSANSRSWEKLAGRKRKNSFAVAKLRLICVDEKSETR